MLVLSRRRGEQVHVGDDVVLTVLEIQASRVRLGIDAPEDRGILRAELTGVREVQVNATAEGWGAIV